MAIIDWFRAVRVDNRQGALHGHDEKTRPAL
jgi:hypothetical protein